MVGNVRRLSHSRQVGAAAPLSVCSGNPVLDSSGNDPLAAGCTILGGKRTEVPPTPGDTKLERQLRKALGAD